MQKQTLTCFASKSKYSIHVVLNNFRETTGKLSEITELLASRIAGLSITLEIFKVFETPLEIFTHFKSSDDLRSNFAYGEKRKNPRRSSDDLRIIFGVILPSTDRMNEKSVILPTMLSTEEFFLGGLRASF